MPLRPPTHKPPGHRTEQQRKREVDQRRGTAAQRGYDKVWQAFRDAVVIERGFRCENKDCGTLVALRKREATRFTPVAHVDHIESVKDRPDLRLDRANVRVLCEPCHNRRTAREQGFAKSQAMR